jgi:hypothetical protein
MDYPAQIYFDKKDFAKKSQPLMSQFLGSPKAA